MPTVTALRDDCRGRVAVELDGAPWRVLPVDVVARASLAEGRSLDRAALRLLRRELRRAEALHVAGRALRHRDLSLRLLAERLERADVPPVAAAESLAALERAGAVDDARVARVRAQALADRGYGDEAIRYRLLAEGLDDRLVGEALAELPGEAERAAPVIARRGTGPRTARYLAGRGFGEEALEAALGAAFGQEGWAEIG
jgi:SOS response regulatory protein OraA/RecX